ncbi:hypothetical protein AYI70_g5746 [Smittium culicis]|uniref:Uncharacterized protein n=1 Tax=Smittium culicis TaxID=133412 RepID=A0A1R1XT40_9FUNG|nr:hypothetical protein AYI70_g5746 [Smittium culicis]
MKFSVIELGILFMLKTVSCQSENLDELTNDENENQITNYSLRKSILDGYRVPRILKRPRFSIDRPGYIPERLGRIVVRPGGVVAISGGIREREILRNCIYRPRVIYPRPRVFYRRPRVIYRRPGVIVPEVSYPESAVAPPVEAPPAASPPVEAPPAAAPPVEAPPAAAPPVAVPPTPVNPFDSGDYQFLLRHIDNICDRTQCNIDFFTGKPGKTVHARLQTTGCNNKSENIAAMKAAAKDLVDNGISKSTQGSKGSQDKNTSSIFDISAPVTNTKIVLRGTVGLKKPPAGTICHIKPSHLPIIDDVSQKDAPNDVKKQKADKINKNKNYFDENLSPSSSEESSSPINIKKEILLPKPCVSESSGGLNTPSAHDIMAEFSRLGQIYTQKFIDYAFIVDGTHPGSNLAAMNLDSDPPDQTSSGLDL